MSTKSIATGKVARGHSTLFSICFSVGPKGQKTKAKHRPIERPKWFPKKRKWGPNGAHLRQKIIPNPFRSRLSDAFNYWLVPSAISGRFSNRKWNQNRCQDRLELCQDRRMHFALHLHHFRIALCNRCSTSAPSKSFKNLSGSISSSSFSDLALGNPPGASWRPKADPFKITWKCV